MGYEIDILKIGDTKSGDAIVLRWGDLYGSRDKQKVVVIDGGYKTDGEKVVEHVRKYYKTEVVDLLILTHPDHDHVGGMETIINSLDVKHVWAHKPWDHNQGLASKFHDGRITDNSISEHLRENLEKAHNLVKIAEKKGIPVTEPFYGISFHELQVLGPTKDYYTSLIPYFKGMPKKAESDTFVGHAMEAYEAIAESAENVLKKIRQVIANWFSDEEIDDKDTTTEQNNSSVICQLNIDGRAILFTGDAGITALEHAEPFINKSGLHVIQIPHHGSRRNIGPSILNKILGEPTTDKKQVVAFVSAGINAAPKHPHQAVLNAFIRRGTKVIRPKKGTIRTCHNAPDREGWVAIEIEQFVEKYDHKD